MCVDGSHQDVVVTLTVYRFNNFNYVDADKPDVSGMLRFVTDECQDAEDNGDRGVSLTSSACIYLRLWISLARWPCSYRLGWE